MFANQKEPDRMEVLRGIIAKSGVSAQEMLDALHEVANISDAQVVESKNNVLKQGVKWVL